MCCAFVAGINSKTHLAYLNTNIFTVKQIMEAAFDEFQQQLFILHVLLSSNYGLPYQVSKEVPGKGDWAQEETRPCGYLESAPPF